MNLKKEFSLNEVIDIAKELAIEEFGYTVSLYGYEDEFFKNYSLILEVKEEK